MLHIHVLLVAPLCASYMAEPGTDQHQSRIAIREAAHYSGAAADLPVEPFYEARQKILCKRRQSVVKETEANQRISLAGHNPA